MKSKAATHNFQLTASKLNLKRLIWIRTWVVTAQTVALIYFYFSSLQLHYSELTALLSTSLAITALSWWRLGQHWPVTDQEYLLHILVDIGLLTAILYFSGGATNPFVSYYLVPLSISAAILPWAYTWSVAGISLSCYSALLFFYKPIDALQPSLHQHGSLSSNLNLHILGMWLNFMLSAALITYFVVKMASALRQQEARLGARREDELRDEQIVAVATLAAGTAHELGTPLATMAVLLQELEQELEQKVEQKVEQKPDAYRGDQQYALTDKEAATNKQLQEDIQLLQQQVSHCKHILQKLVTVAEKRSHKQQQAVAVTDFMQQVTEHWQILHPELLLHYSIKGSLNKPSTDLVQAPIILTEQTLEQAVTNLLNNAADACHKQVELELAWDNNCIYIIIRDDGDGIPVKVAEQMGKPFISTKQKGLGLGLFLSHATISRYGGTIKLVNATQGGTQAELTLPINPKVLIEENHIHE